MDEYEQKILDKSRRASYKRMARLAGFLAKFSKIVGRKGLLATESLIKEFGRTQKKNIVTKSLQYVVDGTDSELLAELIAVEADFEKTRAEVVKAAVRGLQSEGRTVDMLGGIFDAMPDNYRSVAKEYMARRR